MSGSDIHLEGIGQLAITVDDIDRAVAFYRDVLGLTFLFDVPGQAMAFFDCGGVRLYLSEPDASGTRSNPIIYFRVASVLDTHAALVAKDVEMVSEPHVVNRTASTELWMAFFRDPFGNLLAVMADVPVDDS